MLGPCPTDVACADGVVDRSVFVALEVKYGIWASGSISMEDKRARPTARRQSLSRMWISSNSGVRANWGKDQKPGWGLVDGQPTLGSTLDQGRRHRSEPNSCDRAPTE